MRRTSKIQEFKMFDKFFGSKPQEKKAPQMHPGTAALVDAIRERSKVDPLVGAKLGGKEIFQRLFEGMKTAKGVHVESLLCALGALAGYACLANLRAQAFANGVRETGTFRVVEGSDGKEYSFGEALHHALSGGDHSVWSIVGGAAQHAGAKEFPNLQEIYQHSASVLGTAQFGIPRLPENHPTGDLPINYVKNIWPQLFPTVKLFCPEPTHWPVLYSLAIQEAIYAGKNTIDAGLAFRIVMESAIPMSRVDLANS